MSAIVGSTRHEVYAEARRRAAAALLRYCEALDDESGRDLIDAVHNLEAAALVLRRHPSQREQARALRRRVAA